MWLMVLAASDFQISLKNQTARLAGMDDHSTPGGLRSGYKMVTAAMAAGGTGPRTNMSHNCDNYAI